MRQEKERQKKERKEKMRQKEIERELKGRETRVKGRMRNEIHEKKRQEKERL